MKRKFLIRKLEAAGFQCVEGGEHTKVYKDGILKTTVPRHKEVVDLVAKKILKDTGLL